MNEVKAALFSSYAELLCILLRYDEFSQRTFQNEDLFKNRIFGKYDFQYASHQRR